MTKANTLPNNDTTNSTRVCLSAKPGMSRMTWDTVTNPKAWNNETNGNHSEFGVHVVVPFDLKETLHSSKLRSRRISSALTLSPRNSATMTEMNRNGGMFSLALNV